MTDSLDPSMVGDASLMPEQQQPAVQAVDVSVLIRYLKAIVPALLEEDNSLHQSLEAVLKDTAVLDKFRKFITDPQTRAILVQRTSAKGMFICTCHLPF